MVDDPFRYSVWLRGCEGGTLRPPVPIRVDWQPAEEEIKLRCLRAPEGGAWSPRDRTRIEPIWSERVGAPLLAGISVSRRCEGCRGPDVDGHSFVIPLTFFAESARRLAEPLIEAGTLRAGDRIHYLVLAEPAGEADRDGDAARGAGIEIEEAYEPPPLLDGGWDGGALERLPLADAEHAAEGDIPVVVPRDLLRGAEALTVDAGGKETGGILVGYLQRPRSGRPLALVLMDQLEAVGTRQELTSLAFTPETWTVARSGIDRLGSGYLMAGSWHSHPAKFWRSGEAGVGDSGEAPIFSRDDALMHRAVFPAAHSVALVATNGEAGVGFALYGWREGMIRRRAYRLYEP